MGLAGSHSHHSQVCHRVEFVPGALGSCGRVLGRAAVEADLCFHITFVSVDWNAGVVVVRGRMAAGVEVAGAAASRRGQVAGPGCFVAVESCGHTHRTC